MKKKEYKKIIHDIKAKIFPHTYNATDDNEVHEEYVMVIELQDLLEILGKYRKDYGNREQLIADAQEEAGN